MKKLAVIILLICVAGMASAQSAVVPVGGNAQSSAGSVSYTVGQIAGEKAGIIKTGVPVVFFDKRKETSDVIKKIALEKEVRAICVEDKNIEDVSFTGDEGGNKCIAFSYKSLYDKYADLRLATWALYQTQNAAVAITALEILRTRR